MVLAWNGIGSSIDPAVDYDQNWTLLNLIYDGLLTWKKVGGSDGNTLVPDLAQQIPQATDGGKTYVFHLRPGIMYSDGTPVKASDFLRAIEREFTVPGPVGSFYQGIVGGDACAKTSKSCDLSKGIVADDAAGTVTFHLIGARSRLPAEAGAAVWLCGALEHSRQGGRPLQPAARNRAVHDRSLHAQPGDPAGA